MSKPRFYDSMRSAAAAEDLPYKWIQAAKDSGCPGFVGSRVEIEPVRKWIGENRDKLVDPSAGNIEDKINFEKWRKLKSANDRADKVTVVKAKFVEWIHAFASEDRAATIQLFVKELPIAVAGMEAPQVAMVAERYVDRLFETRLRHVDKLETIE